MRLSEAIRLGALMKPQTYDGGFDGVGTCALVAALDAIGQLEEWRRPKSFEEWRQWWGQIGFVKILETDVQHPLHQEVPPMSLSHIIVMLNDQHHWTRERIADWVEQEERKLGLWEEPTPEATHDQTTILCHLPCADQNFFQSTEQSLLQGQKPEKLETGYTEERP